MVKKTFPTRKPDLSELKADKYVKKWIENIAPTTHRAKLGILNEYFEFIEKTAQELILEHSKDLIVIDPLARSDIAKRQIKAYFHYLKGEPNNINSKIRSKPVSHNSAKSKAFSVVLGFFARNNVQIKLGRGEMPKQDHVGVSDKVWRNGEQKKRISNVDKKEWLKKIYNQFTTVKNKAIFLCMKSSGLDPVDLFKTTVKQYKTGYYEKLQVCYLTGNRTKTKEYFQTFFDAEACDSIDTYLRERDRKNEQYTGNSFLFVVDKVNKQGNYAQMHYKRFAYDLKKVCDLLDLKNITTKRIRAWFDTTIKQNLDASLFTITERMMGHKTNISAEYQAILKEGGEEFAKFYKDKLEPKLLILGRSEYVKKINADLEIVNETISIQAKQITKMNAENQVLQEDQKASEKERGKLRIAIKKMSEMIQTMQDQMRHLKPKN